MVESVRDSVVLDKYPESLDNDLFRKRTYLSILWYKHLFYFLIKYSKNFIKINQK